MARTIVWTFMAAALCIHTACKPTSDTFRSSSTQGASGHIFQILELVSEQSPLLKGDMDEGDWRQILDPANVRKSTCGERDEKNNYVWTIQALSDAHIVMIMCGVNDHAIHVRTYTKKNNHELVLVASERGVHHENWRFEFYDLNPNLRKLILRSEESLGLLRPRENEFLSNKQKLVPSENHEAYFSLKDDGTIEAAPWTWMEKRWLNRTVAHRIIFEWNGAVFSKRLRKSD